MIFVLFLFNIFALVAPCTTFTMQPNSPNFSLQKQNGAKNKAFSFNNLPKKSPLSSPLFIDSPRHIDFSHEVNAGLNMKEELVVVDCVDQAFSNTALANDTNTLNELDCIIADLQKLQFSCAEKKAAKKELFISSIEERVALKYENLKKNYLGLQESVDDIKKSLHNFQTMVGTESILQRSINHNHTNTIAALTKTINCYKIALGCTTTIVVAHLIHTYYMYYNG